LHTNVPITVTESAWYCVRVFGGDPQRQRAISGAFFLDAKPHQPPLPVPARVQLTIQDAETAAPLSGTITEITYLGTLPRSGKKHMFKDGRSLLTIPATVRLRVEAEGYEPAVQSPFLDHADLVRFITGLAAEDLLEWPTYERVRDLLSETALTFRMVALPPR
jgi:hypothetical protein